MKINHFIQQEGADMDVRTVVEYNSGGYLIYVENFPGAFARGKTLEEAMAKIPAEISQYLLWLGKPYDPSDRFDITIVQSKVSTLQICDADSDVLFDSEQSKMTFDEYTGLKELAMKSAQDFQALYDSVPDKNDTVLPVRKTFYGEVPRTAKEMYDHTKNVNSYYFGEIGIDIDNEPDIVSCRLRGFVQLESSPDFLNNHVYDGSYQEQWSLRKVCRRFVWHDRIHAKAMYRMATKLFRKELLANPFCFLL